VQKLIYSMRPFLSPKLGLNQSALEWELSMRKIRIYCFYALIAFFAFAIMVSFSSTCYGADEKNWYAHDIIFPSLEEVKWSEEGGTEQAFSWISDGAWYTLSVQQSLVSSSDIFVSWYEQFNWSIVLPSYVQSINNLPYQSASIEDLANYSVANPNWWISYMWKLDTQFYGISANTTKVICNYDNVSSEVEMWTWFHISRIPEYFVSGGGLQRWLAGFDLTPVSTGNLKAWEFNQNWNMNGTHYSLYFRAPANILTQHGDNFTFSINVSPFYKGLSTSTQQTIEINMPPNTEVKEASPSSMVLLRGNTAIFVKTREDEYPAVFTVVSGPSAKSFGQAVLEGASVWLLTPGGWAAIASLSFLSFTGLRGRRIWNRNRLYRRLYKSLVTVYDMYSKDLIKFNQEMDNMSRTIIRMLIEDNITDEQFDRLLRRRDDLLQRMQ